MGAVLAIVLAVTGAARAESATDAEPDISRPTSSEHGVPGYLRTSGAVLFAGGYGLAWITATTMVLGPPLYPLGPGPVYEKSRWTVSRHWWSLYVPIAGPLLSLGYSDIRRDAGARFYLYTSFALQSAGAGLWLAGVAAELFRGPRSSVAVVPLLAPKARGLSAVGVF